MTFIAVIDILNKLKENKSALRSKNQKFGNKDKYFETYFDQKHLLGETHKEVISESRKKTFIEKFRIENKQELNITRIKATVSLIITLVLISAVILVFIKQLENK